MISRCYNKKDSEYHNYGERGITVCDRWKKSVINYMEDMGLPPSKSSSVDRINNNGNYSKENCRWATKVEQNINRRTTVFLEHNGQIMCVTEWANKIGLSSGGLRARLRKGLSISEALS